MNGPHALALDFTGKIVLVVGGSSGIGNGVANAFKEQGAEVHVWGTRASAQDYAGEEGSRLDGLRYARVDAADAAAVEKAVPAFDRLDVLVLAQGTVLYRRQEFAMDGFDHVMRVNLGSLMACALKFHPMLSKARGSIITISSTSGLRSSVGNPAYAASKAGAIGLTRTLGEAWIRDGIRVNGIAPGLVDTKLTKVTMDSPARLSKMLERIPARRLGTPRNMAGAALFLASSLAEYVIGQTLVVDGGLTLA